MIPIPKSSSMERMKENQDIFSFEISTEDMYRLETMPQIGWSGEHPDERTGLFLKFGEAKKRKGERL